MVLYCSWSVDPLWARSTNRIWSNRHQFKLKHRKYVVWMICRGENKNRLVTHQTGLCLSAQVSQTLCLKLNVDYVFTRQFWAKKNPDTFPHIPNTVTHTEPESVRNLITQHTAVSFSLTKHFFACLAPSLGVIKRGCNNSSETCTLKKEKKGGREVRISLSHKEKVMKHYGSNKLNNI